MQVRIIQCLGLVSSAKAAEDSRTPRRYRAPERAPISARSWGAAVLCRFLLSSSSSLRLASLGILLLANASGLASDWNLVWSDEFDKPGLPDAAKWEYETGFIRNNEQQYYTRERKANARVENGMLVIAAR